MIYNVQFLVVIFVLLAVTAKAFQMQSARVSNGVSMKMALSDYREELARTAAAIAAPGQFNNLLLIQDARVWSCSAEIIVIVTDFPSLTSCYLQAKVS